VSNDIVIYGIGVGDPELYKIERGSLRKLAEKTGGRAFFLDEGMDLDAAFAQIQEEMRSQYVIAYSPKNKARDGSYRKLKLEIVTSEMKQRKLRLLHREGYYARTN
jgi:VWFA-related protein